MTFRRRDQVGSDFGGTDVIQVSGDPERRYRFVPAPAGFIRLSEDAVSGEEKASDGDNCPYHQ